MHQIDTLLLSADPVQKLHLTQERIDLHAEHLRLTTNSSGDFSELERSFTRVARSYSDRHGITYSAWRQIGVDVDVLARAGIKPHAKPNRQAPAAPVEPPVETKTEPPAESAPAAKAAAKKAPAKKKAAAKKAPAKAKAAAPTNGAAARTTKKAAAKSSTEPEQQRLPAEAHLLG